MVPTAARLGSPLSEHHYSDLERSWIDRPTAGRALLRHVTNIEGAEILGRKSVRNCSGILFSNIFPGENHVREYCIRVDSPELEQQPDGSVKEIRKYLVPPQSRPLLWFMPGISIEQLKDPSLQIGFFEGLKKYVAADRLAHYELTNGKPRFLAIGIPGAWNWRGTVAIRTNVNGDREPVKGPIVDLDRIVWSGRTVYLVFDADTQTNGQVRHARQSLALELQPRGANVLAVDLPAAGLKEGVKGFDDFLAVHGPEAALRLIETARKPSVPSQFRLTETAVEHVVDPTEDKSVFVCSRLEVIAQTRDENGDSWGRLLTWTDADQNRHQWAMPMSMLAGECAELRSHLLSGGLALGTKRNARELLPEYIHRARPERKILCVSKMGWHGQDSFVLPDGTAAHAVVYVRRWVPVKPIVCCDEFGRAYVEHPSCLKIFKDHGPLTEDLLMEKLGCGDYSFRLNDRRISLQTDPNAATVVYSELSTCGIGALTSPCSITRSLIGITRTIRAFSPGLT